MIPKTIHYCWFGGNPLPIKLRRYIESWKENLPDYKIIEWNETNFDVNSTLWTKQAYEKKMYAFVSDYVRLKVLVEYGGIYLDTDVEVVKSFNDILELDAFGGFETDKTITTGVIGSRKENPILKEFLSEYNKCFIADDGTLNNDSNVLQFTQILLKHGLLLNNQYQIIEGFHVFPKTFFCPLDVWHYKDITENTYAIHYFEGSWLDDETKKRIKRESSLFYKSYISIKGYIGKLYHRVRKDRE